MKTKTKKKGIAASTFAVAAFRLPLVLLLVGKARAGRVVINEISDKGTSSGNCDGSDWVELYHVSDGQNDGALNLTGYTIHDDGYNSGTDSDHQFVFPDGSGISMLDPGAYLVLCAPGPYLPFKIGGDDTITLLDPSGAVESSVGPLEERGDYDVTYALLPDGSGLYGYTTEPTPWSANSDVALPDPETVEEIRARLKAQNEEGAMFFGMDGRGLPVPGQFEEIVDLKINMEEEDYNYMMENRSYELYRPFQSAKVFQRSDGAELLSLSSAGRIRPKGQWTLAWPSCLGVDTIPFAIDFGNINKTQNLFGARKIYMRNKASDQSHMREWVQHRMLARFGLPHLRARTARLFINGKLMGLYELMEAPDQDYVFARSFPDFDPKSYAMYKVKTMAAGCGKEDWGYTPIGLKEAEARIDDESVPPYAFERGEHREKIPILQDLFPCFMEFMEMIGRELEDTQIAYLRNGKDCGEALMEEGLLDRDLGDGSLDSSMKDFYNTYLGANTCAVQDCSDSNLANEVDLTNFLKTFAFYAVMTLVDSPLGNGNNHYLASSGDGKGWKLIAWDLDNSASAGGVSSAVCADQCSSRFVHWSIMRPTCRALEESNMAGPILLDNARNKRYIGYVKTFVETIVSNVTFIQDIQDHAKAIQLDVESDVFGQPAFHDFNTELSPDAGQWNQGNPLLATLQARAEDITAQLQALDSGGDYRMPEDVAPQEPCTDWRPGTSNDVCPDDCAYEGCHEPSWTVPYFCAEDTGKCYHGDIDSKCEGITNGAQYSDMEPLFFCWDNLKMAECPGKKDDDGPGNEEPVCYENCNYDGCYEPSWVVPGFCENETGKCYHGDLDPKCKEVINGLKYDGMEPRGKEEVVCWDGMKMSECLVPDSEKENLTVDAEKDDGSDNQSKVTTSGYHSTQAFLGVHGVIIASAVLIGSMFGSN